jgi:hypothetical protein
MRKQYRVLLEEAQRRSLATDWCQDPFDNLANLLNRNLQRAMDSAIRNYG